MAINKGDNTHTVILFNNGLCHTQNSEILRIFIRGCQYLPLTKRLTNWLTEIFKSVTLPLNEMRKTSKTKRSVSVVTSVVFLATYETTDNETFTDEFFWKINAPNLKHLSCELIRIHNTCHDFKPHHVIYTL